MYVQTMIIKQTLTLTLSISFTLSLYLSLSLFPSLSLLDNNNKTDVFEKLDYYRKNLEIARRVAVSGYLHAMKYHRAANLIDYVFRVCMHPCIHVCMYHLSYLFLHLYVCAHLNPYVLTYDNCLHLYSGMFVCPRLYLHMS